MRVGDTCWLAGSRESEMDSMQKQKVIEVTRRWISAVVIGLDLCPFARRVFEAEKIRYVVSEARDRETLLTDLASEISLLTSSPITTVETTILIHPHVMGDFLAYNDFLDNADWLLDDLGQRGVVQIASFHPDYRFTDSPGDEVENYTNRSPYPMLHLLREESITAVATDPEALQEIPRRNVETLRRLGMAKLREMLKAVGDEPQA